MQVATCNCNGLTTMYRSMRRLLAHPRRAIFLAKKTHRRVSGSGKRINVVAKPYDGQFSIGRDLVALNARKIRLAVAALSPSKFTITPMGPEPLRSTLALAIFPRSIVPGKFWPGSHLTRGMSR